MTAETLPEWAASLLCQPGTGAALRQRSGRLVTAAGDTVALIGDGMVRMPLPLSDTGIEYYQSIGGARLGEPRESAFTMSALDTPIYISQLQRVLDEAGDGPILDIGGGDGRFAWPCLERGRRVVLIDPVGEALSRFRARVAAHQPEWLERLLMIEGDARKLPLISGMAGAVLAIEALYYLNEDFEIGLAEGVRVLATDGRIMLSERDYEGGLVMRMLYDGVRGFLETGSSRALWDGLGDKRVKTRCFTEPELIALLEHYGLAVERVRGIPLLGLLTGWLRTSEPLIEKAKSSLPEVAALLAELSETGRMRRCHIVVARRR